MGSRALLQGIFLTQGLNLSLLHWQPDSLSLSHLERPNLCVQTTVINSFTYADNTALMAESEEELKSLLMKVKEESETIGLNLSIQKTKIVALSLITSWQIDVGKVADFIFLGSKITADGDLSPQY